jgi:hypothetical protein
MTLKSRSNMRRIVLVDHAIQTSLLVALVILETLVAAFAIWHLYGTMGAIIDDNLYRIHITNEADLIAQLFHEGLRVLGWMLVANLLALVVADRLWSMYVNSILRRLEKVMTCAHALDFSAQAAMSVQHVVLEQAGAWRDSAVEQLLAARQCIAHLPAQLPAASQARVSTQTLLLNLKQLIEPPVKSTDN